MSELSLLKVLCDRKSFESYKHHINPKSLSRQSLMILKDFREYFANNDHINKILFNDFSVFFFTLQHPTMDDKTIEEFKLIFNNIQNAQIEVSKESSKIVYTFEKLNLYDTLNSHIDNNESLDRLEQEIDNFKIKNDMLLDTDPMSIRMDLNQALEFTDRTEGLKWRLKPLRAHFGGGLRKGDFGVVGAFVGAGKSSFLASEGTYMASQLKGDDYILWLSNEGDWKEIIIRVYCSALNCTVTELRNSKERAIIKYKELMNGKEDRIRVINVQGWTARDIEVLLKTHCPALLFIDLLDNLNGFDKYSTKESSFEKYGKLYQWGREMATKYCPVLGITQLNGDGENVQYPDMSKLRGSRVDKQGAATFQLMIGSVISDNRTRYLSMPKNKMNSNQSWKCIVNFDPDKSRYYTNEG